MRSLLDDRNAVNTAQGEEQNARWWTHKGYRSLPGFEKQLLEVAVLGKLVPECHFHLRRG